MGTLVIATSNLGKLDEFKEMFKELPVELKCLADYPPLPPPNENGRTFAANAKTKATYYAKKRWAVSPVCEARALPAMKLRTKRTTICFYSR